MTAWSQNRENAIIDRIAGLARERPRPGVRIGIGDDAAVADAPAGDREVLVTTDQIIENTHFIMGSHPAAALGRKALVRGVSDIAAMGGVPWWFTLSLGIPETLDSDWLEQFVRGMFSEIPTVAVQGFSLVGGDVARAPFFTAHVTVAGTAPRGRALLRTRARPRDRVFVSGSLGGSALGLERLLDGWADPDDPAVVRHTTPTARLGLGQWLLDAGVLACMDLSDGLAKDALRLAQASSVALVLDAGRIPQFAGAGLERALHGGEEYELLFTAPSEIRIPDALDGLELHCIGYIEEGEGLWLEDENGRRALAPQGFEHFGSRSRWANERGAGRASSP